jgi:transposase
VSELVIAPTAPSRPARSRPATRAAWVERLARFAQGGLSPAQFCAQEGVSLPAFYSWKRRLAGETSGTGTQPAPAADHGPRLLPVRLQPPGSPLELVLPGGAVLRIPAGSDPAWVRCLVAALGGVPC